MIRARRRTGSGRAAGGDVEQGASAVQAAGEARRLDPGIGERDRPGLDPDEVSEGAGRRAGLVEGVADHLGGPKGQPDVAGVGLDDHGATGG